MFQLRESRGPNTTRGTFTGGRARKARGLHGSIVDSRDGLGIAWCEVSNIGAHAESTSLCGTTTVEVLVFPNQPNSAVAAVAPSSCAAMNNGASIGRIPANVSVKDRAMVTAGLANDVDGTNQYVSTMNAATAKGVTAGRERAQPQIVASSPMSPRTRSRASPLRSARDAMRRTPAIRTFRRRGPCPVLRRRLEQRYTARPISTRYRLARRRPRSRPD